MLSSSKSQTHVVLLNMQQCMIVSHLLLQDEEDQAYLMDDAGNIELSQASTPQRTACAEQGPADGWGDGQDGQDDQDYLQSLDDFEQKSGDIPDLLLLKCMADFDSH